MDEERLWALLHEGFRLSGEKYHLAVQILRRSGYRSRLPLAAAFLARDAAEDALNLEIMEAYPAEAAETGLTALYGPDDEEARRSLRENIALKFKFIAVLERAAAEEKVSDLFTAKLARALLRRIEGYARELIDEMDEHRD